MENCSVTAELLGTAGEDGWERKYGPMFCERRVSLLSSEEREVGRLLPRIHLGTLKWLPDSPIGLVLMSR